MKFILCADVHLDSPFTWVGADAARHWRHALQTTFARIVDLAIAERADALLCAGDLYEHERFRPDTGEFLRTEFERAHPIPVFIAPGNHDWHGPGSLYHTVEWSPNVHVFRSNRLEPVELTDGVTLWGAAHDRPRGTAGFLDGFSVDRGGIQLALFHGSERSVLAFQGSEKVAHAPFTAAQVESAGLRHALVGHFHVPKGNEWFTYPGNPEPLEFGEDGERGAVVIELTNDGSVRKQTVMLASMTLEDVRINVTGTSSGAEIRQLAHDALGARRGMVRLTVDGELAPGVEFRLEDLHHEGTHLEGLAVRAGRLTVGYNFEELATHQTVEGQFVRLVQDAGLDDDERRRVLVTGLKALAGRDDLEVP